MRPLARANWPNLYFLALPVAVAVWGLGAGAAACGVFVGLAWKWSDGFAQLRARPGPLRLETIGASHIVEKVRWHLDRLGVPYEEDRAAGILGLLAASRTVPRLTVPMGGSTSRIGESTEILRYLWGRYGALYPQEAAFLAPTPESIALEERLNEYALDVRRWLYRLVLPERDATLRLWGVDDARLPAWQRTAVRLAYPLLEQFVRRGVGLDAEPTQRSVARAHAFLADVETRLADGGPLLGSGPLHSVDLQLAAASAHWTAVPEFGGPGIVPYYGVPPEQVPPKIREAFEEWQAAFPHTTAYVRKLYAEERAPRPRWSE